MNKNIVPSFVAIITGIVCGSLLWHFNPIVGMIGGPMAFVTGLIGGWILKPKAERVITAEEIKKVVP